MAHPSAAGPHRRESAGRAQRRESGQLVRVADQPEIRRPVVVAEVELQHRDRPRRPHQHRRRPAVDLDDLHGRAGRERLGCRSPRRSGRSCRRRGSAAAAPSPSRRRRPTAWRRGRAAPAARRGRPPGWRAGTARSPHAGTAGSAGNRGRRAATCSRARWASWRHRGRAAVDDLGDLGGGVGEGLVQHEDRALQRRQGLEHHEHRQRHRRGPLGLRRRVVGRPPVRTGSGSHGPT